VTTDKKYQLADWRIRPLTPEMMLYAKMDTHYLLYIYDKMRNELIAREPQGILFLYNVKSNIFRTQFDPSDLRKICKNLFKNISKRNL